MTMIAKEVVENLTKKGLEKADDSEVTYESMNPGEFHAQGDVNIIYTGPTENDAVKADYDGVWEHGLQLAPGNTQGSRHTIDLPDANHVNIKAPGSGASPLQGPRIVATKAFRVVHPEHGNVQLPAGCYVVMYPQTFSKELEKRRLED